MTESRPFYLIPRRELDALRDALARRLTAWSSAWLASQAPCGVRSIETFEPDAQGEEDDLVSLYKAGHEQWCAILRPPAMSAALASVLFDSGETMQGNEDAALVRDVAKDALDDLVQTLLESSEYASLELEPGDDDGLPASASRPGAGSIRVGLDVGVLSFDWVVSHAVLRGLVASSSGSSTSPEQPLCTLREALGKEPVTGALHLGPVEISVRDLVSLQVGDVLALERRVDEPARFSFDDATLCCEAYLGGMDGKKAIRVVSADAKVQEQPGARA